VRVSNKNFYTSRIPKNSKFAIGDWIVKGYGSYGGSLGQVVGYRSKYYGAGDYLIEFENGLLFATKKKYLRGPYKTKEIALKYRNNPNAEDSIEDLKLKPTAFSTEYKTLPKLEKILKDIYTKEPFNFKWLETPISFKTAEYKPKIITVLAVRTDPNVSFEYHCNISLKKQGFNQFSIIRYNDPLTKKLLTKDYSPYQIIFPSLKFFNTNSDLNNFSMDESPVAQVSKLFKLTQVSYGKIQKEPDKINLKVKFENFNKFLSSDRLTAKDLLEVCGQLKIEGDQKILTGSFDFDRLNFIKPEDKQLIRDYHLASYLFSFTDDKAINLNNCPLSVPKIHIEGEQLQTLSTNNNTKVDRIELYKAPLLKNLKGLETFRDVKEIEIGTYIGSLTNTSNFLRLETLEGCPPDVKLFVNESCGTTLTTLKGLPSTLNKVVVKFELESFECSNTVITDQLYVHKKPKSLSGLPKATKYNIEGYTQEEIDEELRFRGLREKLPELDGIF
jgi:hypothetical protein